MEKQLAFASAQTVKAILKSKEFIPASIAFWGQKADCWDNPKALKGFRSTPDKFCLCGIKCILFTHLIMTVAHMTRTNYMLLLTAILGVCLNDE